MIRTGQRSTTTGCCLGIAILLVTLALSAQDPGAQRLPDYRSTSFGFAPGLLQLVAADLDGDGHDDLLGVFEGRFQALLRDRTGGFGEHAPRVNLTVPGDSVAWCVAPVVSGESPSICAWLSGGTVQSWRLLPAKGEQALAFSGAREECRGLAPTPPRGFRPLPFVRDINADGRPDLVLPDAGAVHLYLRGEDGSFAASASVAIDAVRDTRLDTSNLQGTVGQSLTVPMFTLRDVNGDALPDLVSESEARFAVFLQRADGSFPHQASHAVDFEARNEELEGRYHENMDTSNLLKGALPTHQVLARDIDGDGCEDLLVRRGQKVSVYRGNASGFDDQKPVQILRASGNVVTAQVADEDEDDLQDLLVIRMEAVSLSDVFLWLMLPGQMDVTVLVYRNQGGQFARKPSRTIQLHIKFPSIVSLIKRSRDMMDGQDRAAEALVIERGDLDGDSGSDTAVLRDATLQVFLNEPGLSSAALGDEEFQAQLAAIHYSRDVDDYTVDIEELVDAGMSFQPRLPDGDPDLALPLGETPAGEPRPLLVLHDFNGDDRDDVLLLFRLPDESVTGKLYQSRR